VPRGFIGRFTAAAAAQVAESCNSSSSRDSKEIADLH